MKWIVLARNIVDHPADVLICLANDALNLSGGALEEFAQGVLLLLGEEFPPIDSVTICVEERERADELALAIENGLQGSLHRQGRWTGGRFRPQ